MKQNKIINIFVENLNKQAHFTVNQKLQAKQFAQEIISRDKISQKTLLAGPEITGILAHPALNRIQKGERILKFLFEKRYPELTVFSSKFKTLKTKTKPNQYFEDSKIYIIFKDDRDYEIRISNQEK